MDEYVKICTYIDQNATLAIMVSNVFFMSINKNLGNTVDIYSYL